MSQDRFHANVKSQHETRKAMQRLAKSFGNHTHTGSEVSNTPAGTVVATTVQAAINELDTDKANKVASVTAGNIAILTASGDLADSGSNFDDLSVGSHAETHADGGEDEVTPISIGAKALNGFVNRTSSTMAFNNSTREFTITAV